MPDLRCIPVFGASPGDVALARERVRHATERINRLVAKEVGFLLEAVGWEDILPDQANRSQEVINPYVDSAHIFIGILHQRFGKPTGIADSGTESERGKGKPATIKGNDSDKSRGAVAVPPGR